jgi:hypothetical protein
MLFVGSYLLTDMAPGLWSACLLLTHLTHQSVLSALQQ